MKRAYSPKVSVTDLNCSHRGGQRPRNLIQQFAQREDGSLLVFGLMLLLVMTMMGGLAVDLMRYEQRRTELQNTLDRSVLAAASLSQKLDPEGVVNDHFLKAGLGEYLRSVDADIGLNYRIVTASADSVIPTFFMHMMGIDSLTPKAASAAEQRISNVEVSLVLDISGSMNSYRRLINLKPAAMEFVTSVLATSDPGRVSMSIVPYNAQVNIGRDMMNSFNVTANHDYASCVELPASVYNTIDLSTQTKFKHNGHFDPFGTRVSSRHNFTRHCSELAESEVIVHNDNELQLQTAINNLVANGNTSIDIGVKWGAFLLNSKANPVVKDLVALNKVPAKFNNRPLPLDPTTNDVLKVMVVMTDGENTTEYLLKDPYNSGLSNIWRKKKDGSISINFNFSSDKKWWSVKYPENVNSDSGSWQKGRDGKNDGNDKDFVQLTWPDVWEMYSIAHVAQNFYAIPTGKSMNYWRGQFRSTFGASTKDKRLQQICDSAKAAGIIVYGIGFEAPPRGRDEVRKCATTHMHYYDAEGLEISTAFRAIANNISQLRLTQ